MCFPAAGFTATQVFMAATTAATVATGAYTAYSQVQEGNYQAKVAKNNAITQSRMATAAAEKGTRDEQRLRLQIAQAKGNQRAALGASGRELSGSASDLIADTAMMGELDALTLRYNAGMEAYGYEVDAGNSRAQSALYKQSGRTAAAGTLLTTAGSVASSWQPSGSPLASSGSKRPSGIRGLGSR